MASPGELKGQRKGSCGHIMAASDQHEKCARCREKGLGQDSYVIGNNCVICEGFSELQKEKLSTPSYKIRKSARLVYLCRPRKLLYLVVLRQTISRL